MTGVYKWELQLSTNPRKRRTEVAHYDDARKVGQRLKTARERAGLSQRQLSFAGCSAAYLSRIEGGARVPSLQLIRELAHRLGVSERYLAFGETMQEATDPLLEAELALRMDDNVRAEHLYNQQLAAEDPLLRAAALEGLGQLAFREGNAADAVRLLEQASSLYGDDALLKRGLTDTLGRAYAVTGEVESAIGLFERALRVAEEREDLLGGVRLRVLLSYALSDVGQLSRAAELLAGALSHADELCDPQARVRLYWAQCRLHMQRQRPDLAERYGRKVIELLEASEDTYHLARAYRLMAAIELDRDQPQASLELLERARELLAQSGNRPEQAAIQLAEARALVELGQLERAFALATNAAGAFAEQPDGAGNGYLLLAKALAQVNDRPRALEVVELAIELLEHEPNRYLAEAYSLFADLLEAEGRRDEAFEVLRKAVALQAGVSQPQR